MESVNLTIVHQWITFFLALAAFAGVVKGIFGEGTKKNADSISKLRETVEGQERRVSHIETELKYLPDRDTAHRLETGMTELRGQIDVLTERLKPVSAIGERLQELLLENARK